MQVLDDKDKYSYKENLLDLIPLCKVNKENFKCFSQKLSIAQTDTTDKSSYMPLKTTPIKTNKKMSIIDFKSTEIMKKGEVTLIDLSQSIPFRSINIPKNEYVGNNRRAESKNRMIHEDDTARHCFGAPDIRSISHSILYFYN